jgi:hypothetical protein
MTVIRRALCEVYSHATYIVETVDLGMIVGETIVIPTQPPDLIYFAQCVGALEGCLTRFVRGRNPEPSSLVTVVLHRRDDGSYSLLEAYIGNARKAEPGNRKKIVSYEESLEFWQTHAFVHGSVPIVPHTEVRACAWAPEPDMALAS